MRFGGAHLHIEIVDVHLANALQTIELAPQSFDRTCFARIQPNLPQLIYRGRCFLSWIHESNDS
jgi:hypothetical protein